MVQGHDAWGGRQNPRARIASICERCKKRGSSLLAKFQLPLTFALLGVILWGLFRPAPSAPLWEALPDEGGGSRASEQTGASEMQPPETQEKMAGGAEPATAGEPSDAALCRIYLTGGVAQPGVYALARDALLIEAVEAAGGLTPDALAERVNLAEGIADQGHYHIPREGDSDAPGLPVSAPNGAQGMAAAEPALVDLNRAGPAELETLPGIGPGLAQRILDYREANGPFARCEDLMEVPGIKEAKFEALKDRLKPLG